MLLLHTRSHRDSWGHGEEISGFCEGTGPQSYAEHRGGEGKDIPSTASLRSSTEREHCFSDGVSGEPVRPGPAGCVSVLYLIYYFSFYYCIFILFIIIVCFVFCFVNSLSVFFFGCLFVLVCNILIIASNLVLDISVYLPLVLDKLFVLLCCGLLYPSCTYCISNNNSTVVSTA